MGRDHDVLSMRGAVLQAGIVLDVWGRSTGRDEPEEDCGLVEREEDSSGRIQMRRDWRYISDVKGDELVRLTPQRSRLSVVLGVAWPQFPSCTDR